MQRKVHVHYNGTEVNVNMYDQLGFLVPSSALCVRRCIALNDALGDLLLPTVKDICCDMRFSSMSKDFTACAGRVMSQILETNLYNHNSLT